MSLRRLRQRLRNGPVAAVLRSPLHRLLSGSLLLLTYRGRRSGRLYTIPVMYADDGTDLVVFVGRAEKKVWWRNLRDGAEVSVLLRGRDLKGHAELAENGSARAAYVARFPRASAALGRERQPVLVCISDLRPQSDIRFEPQT